MKDILFIDFLLQSTLALRTLRYYDTCCYEQNPALPPAEAIEV